MRIISIKNCIVALLLLVSMQSAFGAITQIGVYNLSSGGKKDVVVVGNLAYIADANNGIKIIDISSPSTPILVGSLNTSGSFTYASSIKIVGNYAYIANHFYGAMHIIDISNPASPSLTSTFNTTAGVYDLQIVGNLAYLAETSNGLTIVDISNPSSPFLVSNFNPGANTRNLVVVGNLAYLANRSGGLRIVDTSNPGAPVLLSTLPTSDDFLDINVVGNFAYVADRNNGLKIIDISNPNSPALITSFSTSIRAWTIDISSNFAYILDVAGGLEVIDISNPNLPILVDSFNTTRGSHSFKMGNLLYIANRTVGLQILQVTAAVPLAIPTLSQLGILLLIGMLLFVVRFRNTKIKGFYFFSWGGTVVN